jgi:hypothetical protein
MPGSLDKHSDAALADLFALPEADGADSTVEVYWSEALTAEPPATDTVRLERTPGPIPGVQKKHFGRSGDVEADYEIGPFMDKGGVGRVFEARQVSTGRLVAIKRLQPTWAGDDAMRSRFLREGILAAGFNHPHLLAVYDVGVDQDGLPFIAMPRVEGIPWSRSIRERSLKDNLSVLVKVADAVFCLHKHGVVHRDIKPANVLLGPQGEVWLTDWGLAARLPDPGRGRGLPDDAASGGTPASMAPEMARDERTLVGFPSDAYLLGAVLHEILTGKPPHAASDAAGSLALAARASSPKSPGRGALATLASRTLKHEPAERPALPEFIASLERVLYPAFGRRALAFSALALGVIAVLLLSWRLSEPPGVTLPGNGSESVRQAREEAARQMEGVRNRLDALFPHAGSQAHLITDDASGRLTGIVIAGVRLGTLEFLEGCPDLRKVSVRGAGISDLSPLRNLPLTDLDVMDNNITDLAPIAAMPLQYLNIAGNPVESLAPVENAPLKTLLIGGTKIADLSPLRGVPLEELDIGGRDAVNRPGEPYYGLRAPVSDLEPLRGAPLRYLRCEGFSAGPEPEEARPSLVSLAFLEGNSTLKALSIAGNAIRDLSPLAGVPLMYVDIADNAVENLTPLANPQIDFIDCDNNRVASIAPLTDQRLGVLLCDGNPISDYTPYLSFAYLRTAWTMRKGEDGLPAAMPEELRAKIRLRLQPPRNPPLADDEISRVSHSGYFRWYVDRRIDISE